MACPVPHTKRDFVWLAVGGALGAAIYRVATAPKRRGANGALKFEYFDLAGAGEKVRLALAMTGTPFDDARVQFKDWPERKKSAKYGQLPILTTSDGADGFTELYQSEAMLRWAGTLGDGSLLGTTAEQALLVNEVLGLGADFHREWSPCLYIGMAPEKYGHAKDCDKGALTKQLRETWLAAGGGLERFVGYFEAHLDAAGGNAFLCGAQPTIADLDVWPRLSYFTKGIADHVPKDSLDKFPKIKAYLQRMAAHPKIAAFYASKN